MNVNGKIAELRFQIWLTRKGYDVFTPMDPNSPADVVWRACAGVPWRSAQVKKVYMKDGFPTVNITRRDNQRYNARDVDYLVCIDFERGHMWILRFREKYKDKMVCEYGRLRLGKTWNKHRREL